jgi:hypothetical protein
MGFVRCCAAIRSATTAISAKVSTPNSRMPGPPVAWSVPSRSGKPSAAQGVRPRPSSASVTRHSDQASPAAAAVHSLCCSAPLLCWPGARLKRQSAASARLCQSVDGDE